MPGKCPNPISDFQEKANKKNLPEGRFCKVRLRFIIKIKKKTNIPRVAKLYVYCEEYLQLRQQFHRLRVMSN